MIFKSYLAIYYIIINAECALLGIIMSRHKTGCHIISWNFMLRHVVCHDYRGIPITKSNTCADPFANSDTFGLLSFSHLNGLQ